MDGSLAHSVGAGAAVIGMVGNENVVVQRERAVSTGSAASLERGGVAARIASQDGEQDGAAIQFFR